MCRNVTAAHQRQFEAELADMVMQLASHPSIVQWVVFIEGWGEYAPAPVVALVRSLDASRLVSSASGWVDNPSGSVRGKLPAMQFLAAQTEGTWPFQARRAPVDELPSVLKLLR